jgi:23S rRNA (uracil1939-C5)-methyltransferase
MPTEETKSACQVTIEKWVYGGAGLARPEGRVVLAPFTLPGEVVMVETRRANAQTLEGRLVRVEQPAAGRIPPACPVFARCGGCHYQHAPYEFQTQAKVEILREVLRRVGKLAAPEQIEVVAGEPWGYRNRIQLHWDGRRLGFREAGSHTVCPVEQCPIASPALNRALAMLQKMTREPRWPDFIRGVELFSNEETTLLNVLETAAAKRPARGFFEWAGERIRGAAADALDYPVDGDRYRVERRSFFQVNRFLLGQLRSLATGGAAGKTAIDLYAGVGFFTLPLTRAFDSVTAVETSGPALKDLEVNTRGQVRAHRMQAGEYLAQRKTSADFLLADPPRSGLGKQVVEELARLKPARLALVSCDPATLARDLVGLTKAGYQMATMTVIDLFPQTFHIECVVQLEL